jgi:hypothetical protein
MIDNSAGSRLPSYHLSRYIANQGQVPPGHFSVLSEMTLLLIGPLEAMGYVPPERCWPDISSGQMFARFLRERYGVDTDAMPSYIYVFEDGRKPILSKAYPEWLLPDFRWYFRTVWLPTRAIDYFMERDQRAVPYVKRLLDRLAA